MIKKTPVIDLSESKGAGVLQVDQDLTPRKRKLQFPVLKLERVKKQRKEHRDLLDTLFPKPVRLYRLMHDVEKSFAKEFASIIGSVDFAEERLAGLLHALKELLEKIESGEFVHSDALREHISLDQRIHQSFEDLIFDCTQFSIKEAVY